MVLNYTVLTFVNKIIVLYVQKNKIIVFVTLNAKQTLQPPVTVLLPTQGHNEFNNSEIKIGKTRNN